MLVYIDTMESRIAAYSDSPDETFPMPDGGIGLPKHIKIVEVDELNLAKEEKDKFHIYFQAVEGELIQREATECEEMLAQFKSTE
jgi:hypothetical protein